MVTPGKCPSGIFETSVMYWAAAFLECSIGSTDVFYDVDQDIMVVASVDSEGRRSVRTVNFVAHYRVHTRVGRVLPKRRTRKKAE